MRYNVDLCLFSILSSLLSFFIFFFVLDKYLTSDESLLYGTIVITTVVTVGLVDYLGIQDDFRQGVLEQLFLLPIAQAYSIIIKWVSGVFKYIIFNSVFWYFLWRIFFDSNFFYFNYLVFVLHLVAVSLFTSSISLSSKQHKNFLSTILIIPITFPQIILSVLSLKEPTYLLLIIALNLVLIPTFIVFSTIIIRDSVRESN